MQYTESSVSMQKPVSVRSTHFYTEHRLVIQRKQEYRLTSLDGDGYKASGNTDMAVTETSGRDKCSVTVIGFIRAFSVHIHVFM